MGAIFRRLFIDFHSQKMEKITAKKPHIPLNETIILEIKTRTFYFKYSVFYNRQNYHWLQSNFLSFNFINLMRYKHWGSAKDNNESNPKFYFKQSRYYRQANNMPRTRPYNVLRRWTVFIQLTRTKERNKKPLLVSLYCMPPKSKSFSDSTSLILRNALHEYNKLS